MDRQCLAIVIQRDDVSRSGRRQVHFCVCTGDMYSHDGNADEPEWVKTEREQFVEFRDKNRDGKMDKEETKDWILPSDYDHAEAEARHLVYESDQNKVGQLAGVQVWCRGHRLQNFCQGQRLRV